jgi:hypothetical protein
MGEMKYIIFERLDNLKFPVIFSLLLEHNFIAKQIPAKAISAGLCKIMNGKIYCYGQSISLKLHCNIVDEDIINRNLLED